MRFVITFALGLLVGAAVSLVGVLTARAPSPVVEQAQAAPAPTPSGEQLFRDWEACRKAWTGK